MFGSAWAGLDGMKPTAAIMAQPDRMVTSRFRLFCTSGRSPLYVVRLPGELTDSGTTFALPRSGLGTGAASVSGIHPWQRTGPPPMVPRLPAARRIEQPELSAVAARIRVIHSPAT